MAVRDPPDPQRQQRSADQGAGDDGADRKRAEPQFDKVDRKQQRDIAVAQRPHAARCQDRNASADAPGGSGRHHSPPAADPPRISAPTHNQSEPRDQKKPENNFTETGFIKSSIKPKSSPGSREQQGHPNQKRPQRASPAPPSPADQ